MEETIDAYFQPMVYKLKNLWVEVLVVDMSQSIGEQYFNLRAMVFWTIMIS